MEDREKAIVVKAIQDNLSNLYVLSILAAGFEESGRVFGSICYPALLEAGWIPPAGLKPDGKTLGPRGQQLMQSFSRPIPVADAEPENPDSTPSRCLEE